jgi:predicted Zn-dependent protease
MDDATEKLVDGEVCSVEEVEDVGVFVELLRNGRYKRLVMENDGDALDTKESIDAMFADVRVRMSRPDSYDYFARRQVRETEGGSNG